MDYKDMNAIGIVRLMLNDGAITEEQAAKYFPELAKSEDGIKDERIRKAVISTFKSHCIFYEVSVDEVLAWFEKRFSKSRQKEIDDAYLKGICDAKHELEKQGRQKSAEWSEEDEMMIKFALTYFRKAGATEDSDIIKWLKSLRPQSTWKPSKEQMRALGIATNISNIPEKEYIELEKLYQDLQKLI